MTAALDAVIARMTAIAAGLPEADGVARFNALYLAVTREVANQAGTGFEDPAFLVRLDVVFADIYFAAIDCDERGQTIPRAWAPLFEARARPGIAPIQFAVAGLNAHINHDLAFALNDACDQRGVELRRGSAQHRDFVRINATLERVQEQVKQWYADGLVGWADEALGRVDDVLAAWSVGRARMAAWTHAETLRALRSQPDVRDDYARTLAGTVGLIGRALLVPTF